MHEMHLFGGETSSHKLHTEDHDLKFMIQLDAIRNPSGGALLPISPCTVHVCIYVFTRPNFLSNHYIKNLHTQTSTYQPSSFFSNIMSSSQPYKHSQIESEPSAGLLTSIKSLVRRPWQPSSSSSCRPSPIRPGTSAGHDRSNALQWDWDLQSNPTRQTVERRQTHPSPKSNPGNNNPRTSNHSSHPAHQRRGRRGQHIVDSMADYLTLAQLENVWQQQDTRRANWAAETNDDNRRSQRSLPRAEGTADTQAALQPPLLSSRDIHPALRPEPLFQKRLRVDTNLKPSKHANPLPGLKTDR